ncbi:MAG: hypothetical protein IPO67_19580 [Deltaproteobacteria bacterium]|nr:hypothetical protein [Deltaproteobacteria bacterium]
MPRALTLALTLLTTLSLTTGCGDKDATDDSGAGDAEAVPDGTFTLDYVSADGFTEADFTGLTITIDRASMSATLTPTEGEAVSLTLAEVPEEEWIKDCYTMNSHSVSEVFTVSPDPVVIGALSIPSPGLTTKCGGRVLLGSVVGGEVVDPTLGFTE